MNIILDFDGTVVVGPYPSMDEVVPGAIEGIKLLQEKGHRIILNTFRADIGIKQMGAAVDLLKNNGIRIDDYMNKKVKPGAFNLRGLKSIASFPTTKVFIDDMSINIPKIGNGIVEYVDWKRVMKAFRDEDLL